MQNVCQHSNKSSACRMCVSIAMRRVHAERHMSIAMKATHAERCMGIAVRKVHGEGADVHINESRTCRKVHGHIGNENLRTESFATTCAAGVQIYCITSSWHILYVYKTR